MKRNILTFSVLMLITLVCASISGAQIRVSCIGDSITYGSGIEDRDTWSYPAQLQAMLGTGYEVRNFGKPGATLLLKGHRPYMQQKEFSDAMAFAGDIAVIHLGINDTDPRDWPDYRDDFIGDYTALIDSIRKANPEVRILIARMTPITHKHKRFASSTRDWHREIQESIITVASSCRCGLIDFHTPLYSRPDLFPDSVHPSAEGATILAKTVYSAITGNYGGLKMPVTYSDNMVLQRRVPLTINGTADHGDKVTVRLGTRKKSTMTPLNGKWSVTFDPMESATGLELSITTGKDRIRYRNVAIGEVWLCSGQSNMRFELKDSNGWDGEKKDCLDKDLRLLDIRGRWDTGNICWSKEAIDSVRRLEYYSCNGWNECDSLTAQRFSAVAYHFGKMLRDSLKVPVGLICNAVGGSTTESWIDRSTIETEIPAILDNWLDNDFTQGWARNRAKKNIDHKNTGATRHPYQPCYLFESGILPLEKYPIKGILWYQGESNAHNANLHERLFRMVVSSWRQYWNSPSMPFHFVQLSSIERPSWPWFRDSQRLLAERIPNVGMAVSSDIGDPKDVHPRNKKTVGERLARIALGMDYSYGIETSGPMFHRALRKGDKVIVEFTHNNGLRTSDGLSLRCFEMAGADGRFYPADADIAGDKVILHCSQVPEAHHIRYAWQPFTTANLVNREGLPASTFRTVVQ